MKSGDTCFHIQTKQSESKLFEHHFKLIQNFTKNRNPKDVSFWFQTPLLGKLF